MIQDGGTGFSDNQIKRKPEMQPQYSIEFQ